MSVYLKGLISEKRKCKLHSVPSKIHADDVAKVSLYFKVTDCGDGQLTSSFRGYPLVGNEIKIPENYVGYIFKELHREVIEGQDRNLNLYSKFDSLTYWNWNKKPTKSDPFISALDWLDMTKAIHEPIEEE